MARSKLIRFVQGGVIVGGEQNADNTHTLGVQAEHGVGSVTILNGASLSPAINTGARRLAALQIPGAWNAAPLTFQASVDGGLTYSDLYDDAGNEVSVPVAINRMVSFDALAVVLAPFRYLKIRSGPSAGAITQLGDRVLNYTTRGL